MTTIDLHELEPHTLHRLLQAETQAWDTELRWDFAPTARLIRDCHRKERLAGFALLEDQQARGYCFFFLEGSKALIGSLFVEPGYQHRDHALRLLSRVLETLMAKSDISRIEAQLPNFAPEELSPFFRALGFHCFVRCFMVATLTDPTPSSPPGGDAAGGTATPISGQDFRISKWERIHDDGAARLLWQTYRQHIDAKLNDQYCTVAGSARLLQNIMDYQGVGKLVENGCLVALNQPSGKLAGILTVTNVRRRRTAHIPQVAVAPEFQGRGLGTMLVRTGLALLKKEGFEEVTLTATELNAGAVRLYHRLGFATFRTFGAFVWDRP